MTDNKGFTFVPPLIVPPLFITSTKVVMFCGAFICLPVFMITLKLMNASLSHFNVTLIEPDQKKK